jgi:predicted RNase H-like nuclease (RuvC/YqgF family)
MAQENKEELVKKIVLLEAQVSVLTQENEELKILKTKLKEVEKSKEEITSNEHNVRKELVALQGQISLLNKNLEAKTKEVDVLKGELTRLANLFDEYIVSYKDQVKMLGVIHRNAQNVEKFLDDKVNDFNKGDKK